MVPLPPSMVPQFSQGPILRHCKLTVYAALGCPWPHGPSHEPILHSGLANSTSHLSWMLLTLLPTEVLGQDCVFLETVLGIKGI